MNWYGYYIQHGFGSAAAAAAGGAAAWAQNIGARRQGRLMTSHPHRGMRVNAGDQVAYVVCCFGGNPPLRHRVGFARNLNCVHRHMHSPLSKVLQLDPADGALLRGVALEQTARKSLCVLSPHARAMAAVGRRRCAACSAHQPSSPAKHLAQGSRPAPLRSSTSLMPPPTAGSSVRHSSQLTGMQGALLHCIACRRVRAATCKHLRPLTF